MRVSSLMQPKVIAVSPDTVISDVIVTLADAHVSALPVVTDAGHMVGVISASDVLGAEAEVDTAEGRTTLFETTMVSDLMTPSVHVIAPEASIQEAARQMLYADVHRLFVATGEQLVGVISATDIVRAVAGGRMVAAD